MVTSGSLGSSGTVTARAAPDCVSTGSTAAASVSGSTSRPCWDGTTTGVPFRMRNVASVAGSSTSTRSSATAACSASPSSTGRRAPFPSDSKVSAAAMSRGPRTAWAPSTVTVTSPEVAGTATSSAARVSASADTSGWSTAVGSATRAPPCR